MMKQRQAILAGMIAFGLFLQIPLVFKAREWTDVKPNVCSLLFIVAMLWISKAIDEWFAERRRQLERGSEGT